MRSNCRIRTPVPKVRCAQARYCEDRWRGIARGRAYESRLCSLRTDVAPRSCRMRVKMIATNRYGPAQVRTPPRVGLPARQMRFSSVPYISAENGPAILTGAAVIGDSGFTLATGIDSAASRGCSRESEHRARGRLDSLRAAGECAACALRR